jgi:hypothetical protein
MFRGVRCVIPDSMPPVVDRKRKVALRETLTKPRLLVLLASLALSAALVLAALALFAAEAQASEDSFGHRAPNAILMKGDTAIQKGLRSSSCWSYWNEAKDSWVGYCADTLYMFPRSGASLRAGTRLNIRLGKPERPEDLKITAYKGFNKKAKFPIGKGQRLDVNLKPVKRDGETVAWDAFFRVNEPNRDYYLDFFSVWKDIPGTHVSSGDASYTFHVKTKAEGG